jgi:response regulator RpfG family c-di-GMP phosphodiesterase
MRKVNSLFRNSNRIMHSNQIREGSGTQFDPEVLAAFFARQDDIVQVQITYADVDFGASAKP